jgi:[acyl-carrier-protein] S-malonyltransferase
MPDAVDLTESPLMTRFAFVFPGQGSQSVGMMAPFEALPEVRQAFAEAGAILEQDLWSLTATGPAEELNKTVNTQPVMLTAGYAILTAWRAAGGPEPAVLAGHSLGEYAALVASEALRLQDALPLVRFRALAMQDAVPEGTGGIAAILGLDDQAIRGICADAAQGQVLEAANFNAPSQVVIAGHREAVERGMALAKARGAKRALLLPMSVPSHCSLMRDAAGRLAERLAGISLRPPRTPVLNNVDVATPEQPAQIKDSLVRQLHCPVRWVECMQEMQRRGVTQVIECGPGGVLTGLNKRSAPSIDSVALRDAAQLQDLARQLRSR